MPEEIINDGNEDILQEYESSEPDDIPEPDEVEDE